MSKSQNRNGVTKVCANCRNEYMGRVLQVYCSTQCMCKAHRSRQKLHTGLTTEEDLDKSHIMLKSVLERNNADFLEALAKERSHGVRKVRKTQGLSENVSAVR